MSLHLIRRAADPTDAPENTGVHWINTTSGDTWFSVGTSVLADWVFQPTLAALTAAGETVSFTARLDEIGGITKGEVVYISGSSGTNMLVSKADNTVFATTDVIAVASAAAANNADVLCQNFGLLEDLDTSAWTTGDQLYLSTSGTITNIHPSGTDAVMRLGFAIKINASTGSIFIDITHQTISNNHDGIVRYQLVNENTGTSASAAYTIVNDAGHRSSISHTGSNYSAVAGLADAMVFYNEGYGSTINAVDGNFGYEWWTDTTDSHNLSATSKMDLEADGTFNTIKQVITTAATATDLAALEIDCDAAGFGDVKALDIDYITGALAATDSEAVMLVNIDESAAVGGDIHALEVLATEGSATVWGVLAGVGVGPIEQLSGTFTAPDSALVLAVDRLAEFSSDASDIALFVADNDTVTIGNATKFEEIEVLLSTVASGSGVAPTFEYSTGSGTWASFTPVDGTNGFKNSGVIAWLDSSIPSWATGLASEYLIRITRTKNAVTTVPIESVIKISSAQAYSWDKDANLNVNTIQVGGANGSTLTTSTALEVKSTTGAFLPPTLTSTQRDALTPTAGMQVYNSTTGTMQNYVSGAWADIGGGGGITTPGTTIDNEIARWSGTTGSEIQGYTSGGPTINDTGGLTLNGGNDTIGSIADAVMYFDSAKKNGFTTNGTGNNLGIWNNNIRRLYFTTTGINVENAPLVLENGTVSTPRISFLGMSDGGLWRNSTNDSLNISVNGVNSMEWDDNYVDAATPLGVPQYATGSLPTASSHTGRWAYDTTLSQMVYSNGSSWVAV
jgi:hypothetical protein